MRPAILNPLFAALTSLPGIGPKLEKLYRRLLGRDDGRASLDLLFHLPTGAIDRRARPKLRDVRAGHSRHRRGRPSTATARRRRTGRARPTRSTPATTPATSS